MLPQRLQLASDHIDAGRFDQAAAALKRFLTSDPGHPTANAMMGHILVRTGEPARALYHLDLASTRDPGNPDLLSNLGNARLTAGDPVSAIEAYRRALVLDPSHLSATIGLGNTLNIRSDLDEADAITLAALQRHPDEPRLLQNRATTLLLTGRATEAVEILRRVVALRPEDPAAAGSLAFALNYAGEPTAEEVFKAHARYGQLMDRLVPPRQVPSRDPSPDRPLRIGILSGDLRAHAVASFIRAWLDHRTRADFILTCYSTSVIEDEETVRLMDLADGWRNVPHTPDADLARLIDRDRTDILLELSGHSTGHRLGIMNLRSAPVQITYLGYPNTTGLRSVDYRIVDSITDPPGSESHAIERLWRLDPCFLCYRPPSPPPDTAVAKALGTLTFGSFNAFAKLSGPTLRLWQRVLDAVPGSRLVLKSDLSVSASARAIVASRFTEAGVSPDRLHILPRSPTPAEHLAAYRAIDIALDPTPYNGTTTTCEALFMGVPIVSLRAAAHAGRVGSSLLAAIGHPELCAATADEYVHIASGLARDPARLAALRTRLRDELLASSLCDAASFAHRFEAALRQMWHGYCHRRHDPPPEHRPT